VLLLAVGLVIVCALAVGAAVSLVVPGITFAAACALGAVLAPTDAVAVAASARRAGLPRRIVAVLEGESLVNDGTGLTLLRVALIAAAAGSVSVAQTAGVFMLSVAVGVLVGAAFGMALVWGLRTFHDAVAVNSLVIIAPVPVYFAAEQLQGSGILAVVITALIVAAGMQRTIGFGGRSAAVDVWRHITFILQAFAFFLIGMEFPRVLRALRAEDLVLLPPVVGVAFVILVATRALFTFGVTMGSPRLWGGPSAAWRSAVVLTWAGARGPVSGLAVFTIPVAAAGGEAFPARDLLVATTFCIIVITLLLAPTVGPLARRLRLTSAADPSGEATARAVLLRAALDRLDAAVTEADLRGDPIPGAAIAAVRLPLEHDLEAFEGSAEGQSSNDASRIRGLREAVLHAQQEELTRLRDAGDVPDQLARRLQVELDAAVDAVRRMTP
jgi:CPA1 family monovalent cation:H+ antiporter